MCININLPTKTVTEHNKLIEQAVRNIQYFNYPNKFSPSGTILLKGCRNCNKLVNYNHTLEPRFIKNSVFVYVCTCKECKTPMLLDDIDFYLLIDKV